MTKVIVFLSIMISVAVAQSQVPEGPDQTTADEEPIEPLPTYEMPGHTDSTNFNDTQSVVAKLNETLTSKDNTAIVGLQLLMKASVLNPAQVPALQTAWNEHKSDHLNEKATDSIFFCDLYGDLIYDPSVIKAEVFQGLNETETVDLVTERFVNQIRNLGFDLEKIQCIASEPELSLGARILERYRQRQDAPLDYEGLKKSGLQYFINELKAKIASCDRIYIGCREATLISETLTDDRHLVSSMDDSSKLPMASQSCQWKSLDADTELTSSRHSNPVMVGVFQCGACDDLPVRPTTRSVFSKALKELKARYLLYPKLPVYSATVFLDISKEKSCDQILYFWDNKGLTQLSRIKKKSPFSEWSLRQLTDLRSFSPINER